MINKSLKFWIDEWLSGRIGQHVFFQGMLLSSEAHPVEEILKALESEGEHAKEFKAFVQSMQNTKSDDEFITVKFDLGWGVKEVPRFIKYWDNVNPDWPGKTVRAEK